MDADNFIQTLQWAQDFEEIGIAGSITLAPRYARIFFSYPPRFRVTSSSFSLVALLKACQREKSGGSGRPSDGQGVGIDTAQVRAERDSAGSGRAYHIPFTATNPGGHCAREVLVRVPKTRGTSAMRAPCMIPPSRSVD